MEYIVIISTTRFISPEFNYQYVVHCWYGNVWYGMSDTTTTSPDYWKGRGLTKLL